MPKGGAVGNAYKNALLRARQRGHSLGRSAVQQLARSLRDAVKRLDDSDATLTKERARFLRSQILGMISDLEKLTVTRTTESVRLTIRETVALHQRTVEKLLKEFGPAGRKVDLAARFNAVQVRAVQALASREKNAALFKTLANRNLRAAAPDLDRLLQSAVARGASVRQVTKDVAGILQGDFPSLQDYDLRKTDLAGMRTVLSDASRIARTETNNALREANWMALHNSPIAIAAKWQLSGAHPVEDECDELADADNFGYGPGFWRLDEWPIAPHPNCGCYPGEVFFRPVAEWGDPKVYEDAA